MCQEMLKYAAPLPSLRLHAPRTNMVVRTRCRRWVTRGYQRIGHIVGDLNFGLIDFDWNARTLHMQVIKV